MANYNKTVLSNGLRIITIPQKEALATTFLVLVEAGSKYETKEINGLSHFLEHMVFKGTAKRPRAIDISTELDALGAQYNAFTSQEYTGYYAKVESHKLDKALDVVTDIYMNPVFDANEIEKEKGVIIEELNMYEDLPMRKVGEVFMDLLYGDQPAGWDVGGRKEVIRVLNREDFLKYRGEHYLAKSTLIVVAGAFDEKDVINKITNDFSHIKDTAKGKKLAVVESQTKPAVKVKYKEVDQTHVVIGCRAFSLKDPRRYILDVLADVLGGGMSSRLFQKVRDELGAAYYVRAEADLFTDHGYIAVSSGVDHAKLEKVVEAVLGEMKKLATDLVQSDELQKAKNHLIGKIILGLESSDELASFYGGQEILGEEIVTPMDLIKKVEEVRAEEILDLAKEIFQDSKLNLALIGPIKDSSKLENLLHF
ncbi:MAG: pitrilysin family protein [Patescibacteria group bacterium]